MLDNLNCSYDLVDRDFNLIFVWSPPPVWLILSLTSLIQFASRFSLASVSHNPLQYESTSSTFSKYVCSFCWVNWLFILWQTRDVLIFLSIQAFIKELVHRSRVILVGVVPFCWSRGASSCLFLRDRFFKYYFKNECGGFIRFPNTRKHSTWFYCFRAFEIYFPTKKISRNYHFKKFSEFNHILFETLMEGVLS